MIVKGMSEPESNKIASQANEILEPVNDEIADAETVNDFHKASGGAKRAATKVTSLQAEAKQKIGDEKELAAIDKLLGSELSLLQAYAGLEGIDRLKLSTTPRLIRQAENSSRELVAANATMASIDRDGAVDESSLTSAVDNLDDQLSQARTSMNRWKRIKNQRKDAMARFRADVGTINGIYGTMSAQRREVEVFYQKPYSSGYDGPSVNDFEDKRESLLNQLEGTSVSPMLSDAKSALADAMRASIAAFPYLQSAWLQTKAGEAPEDMPPFYDYDEATQDVDAAIRRYTSALSAAQSEAGRKYAEPPKPNV